MKLFCKRDPLVDFFRNEVCANLLSIPDARVGVLGVIEQIRKTENKLRTENIANLLKDLKDPDLLSYDLYVKTRPMANISGVKSTSTNTEFGMKVLHKFLHGFGVNAPGISSHFETIEKVSFSFNNVQRHWADNALLGDAFTNQAIEKRADTAGFFQAKASKLLLVDSTIVSNSFCIHAETQEGSHFSFENADIPGVIEGTGVQVKIEKTDRHTLSFSGQQALPFAFTCLELKLDASANIIGMPVFTKHIPKIMGSNVGSYAKTKLPGGEPSTDSELHLFEVIT